MARKRKKTAQNVPATTSECPRQPEIGVKSGAPGLFRQALREPVALGFVPLILFRPWLDGVTYPTANFYFVWGVVALGCVFLVRLLSGATEPRFKAGTALLAGFWLVSLLTLATTVQYDATYRAVVIWAGYVFMFAAIVNCVRTRAGIAILMTALIVVVLAETAYSLYHYAYVLPMVREAVMHNPHLLRTRFGSDTPSLELIHRLQVNRAFGSLLYPNALAAFLILSIPVALSECVAAARKLAAKLREPLPAGGRVMLAMWKVMAATFGIWLFIAVVAHAITEAVGLFEFTPGQGVAWRHGPLVRMADSSFTLAEGGYLKLWLLTTCAAPMAVAAATGFVLRRRGFAMFGLAARLAVLPPLLVLQLTALWLTYSRGGVLAGIAAAAFAAVLMAAAHFRLRGRRRRAGLASACLLLAAVLPLLAGQGPAPNPGQGQQAAPAPAVHEQLAIPKEGMDLTAADLANVASFWLRLSYWQTGLTMARDNLWTGVGLGNFGTVYPNYKAPEAGDVKAAHNDYLQALCETGVLGFLLFSAFWVYFAVWGALRIFREEDSGERWALIGLYCGLVAFLAHSAIDFNFFNPALAFFAFVAAGLFVSRALLNRPEPAPASPRRVAWQIIALPALMAAALVCGMGLRVYISDLAVGGHRFFAVGDRQKLDQILLDGRFFFPPAEETAQPGRPRVIPARNLGGLIPHRGALETIGSFRVRDARGAARALPAGDAIPANALFAITDGEQAKLDALGYVDSWLYLLQQADRVYPHNPKLSAHFVTWYDLLVSSLPEGDARQRYILEYLRWAQETVRRSPREFQYYTALGKGLWLRAHIEKDPAAQRRFFTEGLDAYRQAMELFPASPITTRGYGQALINYGQAMEQQPALAAEGSRLVRQGQELLRRAAELEKATGRF